MLVEFASSPAHPYRAGQERISFLRKKLIAIGQLKPGDFYSYPNQN
ncbi:MAG: hypothetical protein RBG13Loki_1959 [Promethearchaeota archaeon CR_4]|nr:MAG: hypothetical protein RBG13Loki_1959 [Candidatus Lokiarchaeota archaeon CR_4]